MLSVYSSLNIWLLYYIIWYGSLYWIADSFTAILYRTWCLPDARQNPAQGWGMQLTKGDSFMEANYWFSEFLPSLMYEGKNQPCV